jgi:DNA (cytosine-5)-methyltransferase 1
MRLAKEKRPKYLIAENVKGLLSDNGGQTMQLIISILDKLGYNNYFKVLNAKDYGIPQNRERIFIISIRKDIDNLNFEFPAKIPLKLKLQDIIETDQAPNNISYCLDANYSKGSNLKNFKEKKRRQIIIIDDRFKKRNKREYNKTSPTLSISNTDELTVNVDNQIRKITTKECFRLMGFTDQDHEKLKDISNTQKYKMAGNSIVVNVLEAIFKQLFLSDNKKKWLF